MSDADFLKWLVQRLIHVYGEHECTDFVNRLQRIAEEIDRSECGMKESA
jgi:hypothetical protein